MWLWNPYCVIDPLCMSSWLWHLYYFNMDPQCILVVMLVCQYGSSLYVLATIFWSFHVKRDTLTLRKLLWSSICTQQVFLSTLAPCFHVSFTKYFTSHSLRTSYFGGNLLHTKFFMVLSSSYKPIHNSLNPKRSSNSRSFVLKIIIFPFWKVSWVSIPFKIDRRNFEEFLLSLCPLISIYIEVPQK